MATVAKLRQPFWPVRSTRSGDSKLEEQSDEQFTSASAAGVALVAPQRGSVTTTQRMASIGPIGAITSHSGL